MIDGRGYAMNLDRHLKYAGDFLAEVISRNYDEFDPVKPTLHKTAREDVKAWYQSYGQGYSLPPFRVRVPKDMSLWGAFTNGPIVDSSPPVTVYFGLGENFVRVESGSFRKEARFIDEATVMIRDWSLFDDLRRRSFLATSISQ